MSNFLGDVRMPERLSSIVSSNELMEREGIMLQKSMNFRPDGSLLSVFLVLEREDGLHRDTWDAQTQTYSFEGHDSTTVETGGKSPDQLLMYGSGKLTDNGKFYKESKSFNDGVRPEPLQVQVYEKLDPGVWFDKGIFNLVDAQPYIEEGRKIFTFYLQPSDAKRIDRDVKHRAERFMSAGVKARIWARDFGRCAECDSQLGLRFSTEAGAKEMQLLCAVHRGEVSGGGFLG